MQIQFNVCTHTRVRRCFVQRGLPEPIASDLVAALRDSVGYSVAHTATEAVMGALPDFLRRSLMFTLTNVLTRGLTHTIAPTCRYSQGQEVLRGCLPSPSP